MNRLLLAALAASLGLSACAKQEEAPTPAAQAAIPAAPSTPTAQAEAPKPAEAPVAAAAPAPQAAPAFQATAAGAAPAAAAQPALPPNTGKLVQIMQAGGYTYGEVEGPGGARVWVAGGHIEAKPGDLVQWGQFAEMHNFTAKSLNRTFETILFVNSWGPVGGKLAEVAPHGSLPGGGQPAAAAAAHGAGPHGGGSGINPMAAPERTGVVKSATTAAGYTYLEVVQGDATVWIAAPEAKVKQGDKVTWSPGMVMRNFTAKSLNRTFEQIVFAGGVSVVQ